MGFPDPSGHHRKCCVPTHSDSRGPLKTGRHTGTGDRATGQPAPALPPERSYGRRSLRCTVATAVTPPSPHRPRRRRRADIPTPLSVTIQPFFQKVRTRPLRRCRGRFEALPQHLKCEILERTAVGFPFIRKRATNAWEAPHSGTPLVASTSATAGEAPLSRRTCVSPGGWACVGRYRKHSLMAPVICARSLWSDLADRIVVTTTQRELRGCTEQASLEN